MSETIYLDVCAQYLQKGVKFEVSMMPPGSPVSVDVHATSSIDYLTIPALLKIKFGNSTVKPFLLAGPDLGIKLSAESKVEVNGTITEEEDLDDEVESLDFAIAFGGGFEFPASNVSFFVQGLYSLGLTDIAKETNEEDDPGKVTTRGIIILAGIRF